MSNKIYILAFDWFEEGKPWYSQESTQYYFFNDADEVLETAHKICHDTDIYLEYDEPKNMYLYKVECGIPFSEDSRYYAAWFDLDKKIRF